MSLSPCWLRPTREEVRLSMEYIFCTILDESGVFIYVFVIEREKEIKEGNESGTTVVG